MGAASIRNRAQLAQFGSAYRFGAASTDFVGQGLGKRHNVMDLRRHAVGDIVAGSAHAKTASSSFRYRREAPLASSPLPDMKACCSIWAVVAGSGETVKVASLCGGHEGKGHRPEGCEWSASKVPLTPFPRGDDARSDRLRCRAHARQEPLARRGMAEAVTWSFIAKAQASCSGGQVRLRSQSDRAELSECGRAHSRAGDERERMRPRLSGCGAVRGRTDLQGDRPEAVHRRVRVRRALGRQARPAATGRAMAMATVRREADAAPV